MTTKFKKVKIKNSNLSMLVAPKNYKGLTLFPSPGEYPIYDKTSYDYMEQDKITEKAYISALERTVKGRRVLDIGTGQYFDWAHAAVKYGAKEAVGIEGIKSSFLKAKKDLSTCGKKYRDKIRLFNKWSEDYHPTFGYDLIISEIIGSIGGSEGAAVVLKDAQERMLNPGGIMLPYKCVTMAGAICLQDYCKDLVFDYEAVDLMNKLFNVYKGPLKPRLGFSEPIPDALMTTVGPVETLNFQDIKVEDTETIEVEMIKDGKIDGVMLWINLWVNKDDKKPIDSLYQKTAWDVMYLPIFNSPIYLKKGTAIYISLERKLSSNKINPNYKVKMEIEGFNKDIDFNRDFYYNKLDKNFNKGAIYNKLFFKD